MSRRDRNSGRPTGRTRRSRLLIGALAVAAAALAAGASLLAASHLRAAGSVPASLTPPKIFGVPEVGAVLQASHGTWSDSPTSYLYRWKRCDAQGRECTAIAGGTSRLYVLAGGDVGATLRVAVTAINAAGRSAPARSAATAIVTRGALRPPTNLQPPELTGAAQVGLKLTATRGSWSENPSSYSYQWLLCGAGGGSCSTIAGAISPAYLLSLGDLGKTLRISVTASNAAGKSAPVRSAPGEVVTGTTARRHLEYVLQAGTVRVYSIDEGFAEVESFPLPDSAGVRGTEVCPATGVLYVSYGGQGGGSNGGALAYSLTEKKLLWAKSYSHGVDSFALSKDCSKLYMPVGEYDSSGEWKIVNTASGNDVGGIATPGSGGHDGTLSFDGKLLVMGEKTYNHLVLYHTETGKVQTQSATLVNGVRPNTVDGSDTEVFTTASGYDGFQVSSAAAGGAIQYTENFNPGGSCPQSTCSHGISLSPDSSEAAVIDAVHNAVQFWNVAGVGHGIAPIHVATVPVKLVNEGWVQHSSDGRYVFVGDSGDVIATAIHKVVAHLPALEGTRESLEVDWEGGRVIATTQRVGVGHSG